jgi:predicted ATPase
MNNQPAEARRCAQEQVTLSGEEVLPFWLAGGAAWSAWADLAEGDAGALGALQEATARWRGIGAELVAPHFAALLAEAHLHAGRHKDAGRLLDETISTIHVSGERYYEPELLRLRGLLLQAQGQPVEAEVTLWEAIERADVTRARAWSLRAATSLARLEASAGRAGAGRRLLAQLVAAFSPQAQSPDLDDARALLTSA